MTNVEELERALNYPWEKWAVFLHPGAAAGRGGGLQRARSAWLAQPVPARPWWQSTAPYLLARANPDARVLLTTFSKTLADALRTKLKRLIYNEPRLAERLEVEAVDAVGERLYRAHFGSPEITSREQIQSFLEGAISRAEANRFSLRFLLSEWESVVDAWQFG